MTVDADQEIGLKELTSPITGQGVIVDGTPILGFFCPYTAHDGFTLLVKLHRKSKTARIVPIDASQIKIDPASHQIVALSNRRLETYGDLGLWTSSLFVGKAPSLRYRRVKLPFGDTASISLRPSIHSGGRNQ